ncbi:MAG: prolipoprotein diacylglyceryl transferase [Armatimonas sp.]
MALACYGLACLLSGLAFWLMGRRHGLVTREIAWLASAWLVGSVLGANLVQQALAYGAPGSSALGGLVGGCLAVWGAKKYLGINRPTGDVFVVALLVGEMVARWGCFFARCYYGRECLLPWAVYQHDALRHPTQIYLSLVCGFTLIVLFLVERKRPPANTLFVVQGLIYPLLRYVVELYREQEHLYGGLAAAQWACLAAFLYFAWQGEQLWTKTSHSWLLQEKTPGSTI